MTYSTDNITVAAALRSHNHSIIEIMIDGRRATFVFNETSEPDATQILLGNKLVDAISFHEQLRKLSGLAKSMANSSMGSSYKAHD